MGVYGGCSTTEIAVPPAPEHSGFLDVPHPLSTDIGEIQSVFKAPGAPDPATLKDCDAPYKKLQAATTSREELRQGALELVQRDPQAMHWCFYSRLGWIEDEIKQDDYVDVRQKRVIETFGFLVPVAEAFAQAFVDSRYLRLAVARYRKLSEWVFYRKLQLSPEGTLRFAEASNPFGVWREPATPTAVLDKYKIPAPTPVTSALSTSGDSLPTVAGLPPTAASGVPLPPPDLTPPPQPAAAVAAVPPPPLDAPSIVSASVAPDNAAAAPVPPTPPAQAVTAGPRPPVTAVDRQPASAPVDTRTSQPTEKLPAKAAPAPAAPAPKPLATPLPPATRSTPPTAARETAKTAATDYKSEFQLNGDDVLPSF